MRLLLSLLLVAGVASGAMLMIAPPAIYDCQNGEATAVVSWSGASGPVTVHVLQPGGPALTGLSAASGTSTTGAWVVDGMQFFLVNQAGGVEATATAHVSCGGTASTLDQGLQGGSYFPLQVGNTWVYRYNDRFVTGNYVIRSITGTEVDNGLTYFVMTQGSGVVGKFRGDDNGVIWTLTSSGNKVYLDPQTVANPSSGVQQTGYSGPLGAFTDALTVASVANGLESDRSVFVRGIGLANFQATMLSGSSGGFLDGMDLVEARLNGVRLSVPAASVNLSVDSADLDVSDRKVANCALPCYFVACGLAGGIPDPPGTYRPCAQVRLETSASTGSALQVQLLNSAGAAVFSTSGQTDANGNSLSYVSLPLYVSSTGSNTFTVLPPGNYQVVARVSAAGVATSSSALNVLVR